jgi:hypothetical protein
MNCPAVGLIDQSALTMRQIVFSPLIVKKNRRSAFLG